MRILLIETRGLFRNRQLLKNEKKKHNAVDFSKFI